MEKFKELKDKRGTREYDMWFLKYSFDSNKDKDKDKDKNIYRDKSRQKRNNTIKKRPKQLKIIKSSEFF